MWKGSMLCLSRYLMCYSNSPKKYCLMFASQEARAPNLQGFVFLATASYLQPASWTKKTVLELLRGGKEALREGEGLDDSVVPAAYIGVKVAETVVGKGE